MSESTFAERLAAAEVEPCDDGTQEHKWRHSSPPCENCGDHDVLTCDTCWEQVPQPGNSQLYKDLVAHYGIQERYI